MGFGEQLRIWREARTPRVTQDDLAQAIGRTRAWIARIETERPDVTAPDRATCDAIARALEVPREDVWAAAAPDRLAKLDRDLLDWHEQQVTAARGFALAQSEAELTAALRLLEVVLREREDAIHDPAGRVARMLRAWGVRDDIPAHRTLLGAEAAGAFFGLVGGLTDLPAFEAMRFLVNAAQSAEHLIDLIDAAAAVERSAMELEQASAAVRAAGIEVSRYEAAHASGDATAAELLGAARQRLQAAHDAHHRAEGALGAARHRAGIAHR